eukprot:TRINITY_DN9129_c0_g1_i1.p1 TRINITY_DN9129_c0_g1~~TRINITY_DN9129_c0_g1_i1.p1  ORF type:complete len:87 (+),score=21.97 TRINITY_DN9129_c0_g1_i1:168-428(+)
MEDTYTSELKVANGIAFYGVFDGHGGHRASKYVAEKIWTKIHKNDTTSLRDDPKSALIRGHQQVDKEFLEVASRLSWDDGTTAVQL